MSKIEPIHVIGGGLAGSEAAWQIAQAGVPVVLHEMRPVRGTDAHKTRRPCRARLLQLFPVGRCRNQRGRPAASGDAHAGLVDHGKRRRQSGAGGRRAGGRPRRLLRCGHGGARSASARHHRAWRDRRPAAGGMVLRDRRHRSPHLAGARRGDPRTDRRERRSPSSTPSRRSSTASPSTWTSPGSSRATTRSDRAARARTTSTAP